MENFIKESKSGFDFASVSSHTRMANANRMNAQLEQQQDEELLSLISRIPASLKKKAKKILSVLAEE